MLGLPSPETQLPQPEASVSTRENTHQVSFSSAWLFYKAAAKTRRSPVLDSVSDAQTWQQLKFDVSQWGSESQSEAELGGS